MEPITVRERGSISTEELRDRLEASAFRSVYSAFGKPKFYTERGSAAFRPGSGSRSLTSLSARAIRVYRMGDSLRADFADDEEEWKMVPVVDLALRNGSGPGKLEAKEALMRIGIGRPYQAPDMPLGCYLQVNHVFPLEAAAGGGAE